MRNVKNKNKTSSLELRKGGVHIPPGKSQKRAGTAIIYAGTATRKSVAVPAHYLVAVPA